MKTSKKLLALLICTSLAFAGKSYSQNIKPDKENKERILQKIDKERIFDIKEYNKYCIGSDINSYELGCFYFESVKGKYDFDGDKIIDAYADFQYLAKDHRWISRKANRVEIVKGPRYSDKNNDGSLETKTGILIKKN